MRSTDFKTAAKSLLLKPAQFYNNEFAYTSRLELGFARGALNVATRRFDPLKASTWEFSAFSQNGEDGVIDHLLSLVREPNHYFVEIGASDGLENNTSHLAFAKKYDGIMVEGDPTTSANAERFLQSLNFSVKYVNQFVEPTNVTALTAQMLHRDPDFFSLDIDSNDYFVAKALLADGIRPKVICLEYNSAFGPDAAYSIQYTPGLDYLAHHPSQVYYGVSVAGWRALFEAHGYRFVTVERRGINAFFVDPAAVDLPAEVEGLPFAENATQLMRHGAGWQAQFEQIKSMPLLELPEEAS